MQVVLRAKKICYRNYISERLSVCFEALKLVLKGLYVNFYDLTTYIYGQNVKSREIVIYMSGLSARFNSWLWSHNIHKVDAELPAGRKEQNLY